MTPEVIERFLSDSQRYLFSDQTQAAISKKPRELRQPQRLRFFRSRGPTTLSGSRRFRPTP